MSTTNPAAGAYARLKALVRARFGVAVQSLTPLRGDASDRAYVRLLHPGGERTRSVGMIASAPFQRETLPFIDVQRHFEAIGLSVPQIFAVDGEAGVILLQDCGDQTLEDVWCLGGWEKAGRFYAAAVDAMAAMQEAPREGGGVALARRFDPSFFVGELHHARKHAFESLLGMKTDASGLDASFRELCREICQTPFRLTHRDYHSRNLMVSGEVFIIDFQDARMGPCLYDLASLAFDSYVGLDDAVRGRIIHRYWETCGHRHFSDKEGYERALCAAAIQRNLKAIGTFAFQKTVRGAARYLENIPRTARMVQEHFEKRKDLAHIHVPLAPYLEALMKMK